VLIAIMIFTITGIIVANVGVEQIFETVRTHHGEKGFNPFESKTFGPLFLLWMVIQQVIGFPSFAPTMQRIASTDGARTARQFTLLSWLFGSGRGMMMLGWGVAALAVVGTAVPEGMDEEAFKKVAGAIYLGQLLPPVVFGVVLAALLAAFISTVDSYILTNATLVVNDVICPMRRKETSPRSQLWLLRITVAVIAVLLFIFGIFDELKESIFEYVILTGTMMQGAGIILIGGLYWKRGSTAGAYATVVACCLIPVLGLVSRRVFPELSFFELFHELGNVRRSLEANEFVEMLKSSINILLPVKPVVAGLTALTASPFLYIFVSLMLPDSRDEENQA
jgi:SSS family solute:Na+ symporter